MKAFFGIFLNSIASFDFYQDSEIEIIKISAKNIVDGSIYWYLDDDSTVYLSNLIVDPKYRNNGLGEKMQMFREQIGISLGAKKSCLCVNKKSWMYEWYQRRGYFDIKKHNEDGLVWMQKNLN